MKFALLVALAAADDVVAYATCDADSVCVADHTCCSAEMGEEAAALYCLVDNTAAAATLTDADSVIYTLGADGCAVAGANTLAVSAAAVVAALAAMA